MQKDLDHLVERLTKAYPHELVSVVLYGSAAGQDFHKRYSDFNVLCILDQMGVHQLDSAAPVLQWWRARGHPSPLMLTTQELTSSTDCFPIEFLDIKHQHRILYGEDLISSLSVDLSFHRPQVEHELRSRLLRLRQRAAAAIADKGLLRELLADSVTTFTVLIRHAVLLSGGSGTGSRRDVIQEAGAVLNIDAAPFLALLDLREEKTGARSVNPFEPLSPYLREIGKVIEAVDRQVR